MATIERKRTLRPSTRLTSSTYKINTEKVTADDTLNIKIDHEDEPGKILFEYQIDGSKVANLNSMHFKADKHGKDWTINWTGAIPNRIS